MDSFSGSAGACGSIQLPPVNHEPAEIEALEGFGLLQSGNTLGPHITRQQVHSLQVHAENYRGLLLGCQGGKFLGIALGVAGR